MNPKLTLIAEGEGLDIPAADGALGAQPELKAERVEPDRLAVAALGPVVKWLVDVAGGVGAVMTGLAELRKSQPAGVAIRLQRGDKTIEITGTPENVKEVEGLVEELLQRMREGEKM